MRIVGSRMRSWVTVSAWRLRRSGWWQEWPWLASALLLAACGGKPSPRAGELRAADDAGATEQGDPTNTASASPDTGGADADGGVGAEGEPPDGGADANRDAAADATQPSGAFDCPGDHWGLRTVDAGSVNLQVACQGQGPTLVMLHGFPEFYLAWNELAHPLVAHGYRVVAPDQRGYDVSDKPSADSDYAIDHLVADVVAVIDQAGSSPVILVAHDWGGVVAWVVAHRYPGRLRGLVILDGPHPDIWGNANLDPTQAMAANGYIPIVASPAPAAWRSPFVAAMLFPHLPMAEQSAYQAAWNQPNAVTSMTAWYRANVYSTYTLPTGNTISVPTLALWGRPISSSRRASFNTCRCSLRIFRS